MFLLLIEARKHYMSAHINQKARIALTTVQHKLEERCIATECAVVWTQKIRCLENALVFMKMRPFTDTKFDTLPPVFLTSPDQVPGFMIAISIYYFPTLQVGSAPSDAWIPPEVDNKHHRLIYSRSILIAVVTFFFSSYVVSMPLRAFGQIFSVDDRTILISNYIM
jgi:hypothetical protein